MVSAVSACRLDWRDRHDSSVSHAGLQHLQRRRRESPRLARPAAVAGPRRALRCTRQDTKRIGSKLRHWPVPYLRPRTQLSAAPTTWSKASFGVLREISSSVSWMASISAACIRKSWQCTTSHLRRSYSLCARGAV